MAQLQFNSAAVEPTEAMEAIPAGEYTLLVKNVELKPTKAGTGSYLNLQLSVQGGPMNGKTVFDMITYSNPNPQAVEIGHRKLSGLCRAAGIVQLTDTGMLLNRVVNGKVSIKIDKTGQYDPSNEVKMYSPATAATQPASTTTNQQTQTQQAQNSPEPEVVTDGEEDAPWAQ